MNNEADNATIDANTWEAAVARLEAKAEDPLLLKIIERRGAILKLRAARVGWPEIATLLCEFGIKIGPGTLRNYSSRIRLVITQLETDGEENAADQRIYELCCERARPGQGRSARDQRSTVSRTALSSRPSGDKPVAWADNPRTSVIRNPDKVL